MYRHSRKLERHSKSIVSQCEFYRNRIKTNYQSSNAVVVIFSSIICNLCSDLAGLRGGSLFLVQTWTQSALCGNTSTLHNSTCWELCECQTNCQNSTAFAVCFSIICLGPINNHLRTNFLQHFFNSLKWIHVPVWKIVWIFWNVGINAIEKFEMQSPTNAAYFVVNGGYN